MYNIDFYETSDGFSDVHELLDILRAKAVTSKDARIQYTQIARYIELLKENGTNLPLQITKHLKGDIWELRPGKNRVLYFFYTNETYVLLHHFQKKTKKTPPREIDRAMSEMNDYISRREVEK